MSNEFGDFFFINDDDMQDFLTHDFKIIQDNHLWNYFQKHDENKSFMFCNELQKYKWYPGHSGASYGCSMRIMEHIAKYGWTNYVTSYHKT